MTRPLVRPFIRPPIKPLKALAWPIVVLAMVAGLALPAAAADFTDGDAPAIRTVIQDQINAFQRDDGTTAYSYASPSIKQVFPSVGAFMDMVRGDYQPVYHPRSVTFGALAEGPTGPEQKVFLVGPDGRSWVALYTLQRQSDGSWKINRCLLVPNNAPSA